METKRIFIGTLVGGVAMFFLGWVIYGMLMMNVMSEYCDDSLNRPKDQMIWGALIASNLVWGLLVALLLSWTGMRSAMGGMKLGATLGLLAGLAFDLSMYSMSTMIKDPTFIALDVIAFTLWFALSAGIAGWVMGRITS